MAKRTQRRQLRNGKDQVGCMWGLISMFDFRHGRYTRRLLSDRRGKKHSKGAECSQDELMLSHCLKCQDSEDGEERTASADNCETSVKYLMEEDMFNELGPQNLMNATQEEGNIRENSHSRNTICKTVDDNDVYDLDLSKALLLEESCCQGNDKKELENYDPQLVLQKLCQILEKSCSGVLHMKNIYDTHSDQTLDKERLTTFIKVLIDQGLHCNQFREDGQFQQSSVLMEALHKFGSQKDLFLKLLQDPNSLMVNQIQGVEETIVEKDPSFNALTEFGFAKEKPIHSKTDEVINNKPRKFFRRRSKSQESYHSLGNENFQSSSNIVILKPGSGPAALQEPDSEVRVGSSMQSQNPMVSKIEAEKRLFSFSEIKRKLKHAIRKERQVISINEIGENLKQEDQKQSEHNKAVSGENIDWCFSPNRNHFFNERYISPSVGLKKRETLGKMNQTESLTASSDTPEPGVSDIYVKAKKHILEMIDSMGNDAQKISGQLPNSLGTVLSLSEYDLSPTCSPSMGRDVGSPSDHAKLSDSSNSQSVNRSSHQIAEEDIEYQPSPSMEHSRSPSYLDCDTSCQELELSKASEGIPSECGQGNAAGETLSSKSEFVISEGNVETSEIADHACPEDNADVVSSHESNGFCSSRDAKADCADAGCDTNMLSRELHLSVDGEILSSPSASPNHSCVPWKVENLEGSIDRTGRPSPVSVLDQCFAEDDISPARTISWPVSVDMEIQPRQIVFNDERPSNDQEICIRISSDDNETAFDYVEAVLLGSGLNWDEYLLRWLSSDTVLDPPLYDEVELFSSKSRHEQRMLFDCTNEVLGEVCERYFGSFHGSSWTRRNVRVVPKGMDLIHEIWEGVEWHLFHYPQSQSLDQLIKKDMVRSRAWMDLRLDTEHIGLEMEKAILEDLVEDTVWSSIYGTYDSDSVTFYEDLTECESTTDAVLVAE